jgi:phenylacetate-CoA ligase
MDKADLRAVSDDLQVSLIRQGQRAYMFSSGGTTAAPTLSFIPTHMFLGDIRQYWDPLNPRDVLCNLFAPGKLWSAHYFFNALGETSAAVTMALGSLNTEEEFRAWADFMNRRQVTAIAATPTILKGLFRFCRETQISFDHLHKVLWVGEAFDRALQELVQETHPQIGLWGLYGSTETWVIGYNFPGCPLDTFHVLPYQIVELVDGLLVISNVHPDCLNPLLRYKVGDRVLAAACSCNRPALALRVLGRGDHMFKFRGVLLDPSDLLEPLRQEPGVQAAQIAVLGSEEDQQRLQVRVISQGTAANLQYLRNRLFGFSLDLSVLFDRDPEGFELVSVERLTVNRRTLKTPEVVWEEQ